MTERRTSLLLPLAGAGIAIGVAIVQAPMLADYFASLSPAPRSIGREFGCQPPSEHEQLHIVVVAREGRFVADCMYVGARGAYQRGRK